MSQNKIKKQDVFCIIAAWSVLIFVGYNVLTVEAATDKQTPKEICKGFDSGKWNDDSNKCEFSKQGMKIEDDAEFDHVLSDEGLYEDYNGGYNEGIAAKKDKEKLTGYDEEGRQLNVINGDYDEEPKQKKIEDWKNTVTTEEEDIPDQEEYFKIRAETNYKSDDNVHEIAEKLASEQQEQEDSESEEVEEEEQEEESNDESEEEDNEESNENEEDSNE